MSILKTCVVLHCRKRDSWLRASTFNEIALLENAAVGQQGLVE